MAIEGRGTSEGAGYDLPQPGLRHGHISAPGRDAKVYPEKLELSACDRGCRFGLRGCGGLCRLRRGLLGLGLLGLIGLLLDSADLHAACQDGSILYADPVGYHIARQRAFAANIQTVRALDVT